MTDVIDADGYRANVGIVLMRGDGRVFLGRRVGGRGWQFPQGGMREGEDPHAALLRELREEIGLGPEDVAIAGSTARWLRYRLPSKFVRRNQHPVCIGQKQRWFLLRLAHEGVQFHLDTTAEPEFDKWRWADYWEPVREVIHFKRRVYRCALHELGAVAFPGGLPAYPDWWEGEAQ
ncbi:MAG: RNA pyrophosphohydrolase [Steroidobacteraceae bacterium]|nr:RNA pyrophosphohydrolase [Steroidobacteraceae bacterium]